VDTVAPSTGFDIEKPSLYVLTNVAVWVAVAVCTELFVLGGELVDGLTLGGVGGFTYGTANLLVRRFGDD